MRSSARKQLDEYLHVNFVIGVEKAIVTPYKYCLLNTMTFAITFPAPESFDRCVFLTLNLYSGWPFG